MRERLPDLIVMLQAYSPPRTGNLKRHLIELFPGFEFRCSFDLLHLLSKSGARLKSPPPRSGSMWLRQPRFQAVSPSTQKLSRKGCNRTILLGARQFHPCCLTISSLMRFCAVTIFWLAAALTLAAQQPATPV